MNTKTRTLKSFIWSILLYGCERWTIPKTSKGNWKVLKCVFFRKLLRASWTERQTNEDVLQLAGMKRSLMKFLGHINRKKWSRIMHCGKFEGKRSRGRQRTFESLHNQEQMVNTRLMQLADDRVGWRTMIVDACVRPDI
ncbi:endonuclease-reverse transcriptase [Plakobranchus ocellatus]|uniref:Endonuclease-reverse transcriptase n=1 Tax=Plakobranchus ocellatus TaxID=259542 RepID=A0AAV4AML3_9GAST|nr:endonuclease-reverse transcriptase [Plakobranchus ocellatus]